ncbi:MAG: hypothetical protein ACPGSB_08805 [Opitutales bacterium]
MDTTTPPPLKPLQSKPSVWFWVSAVTVVLSYLIAVILLLFMMPVFTQIFADFGAELPAPTLWVLSLSNFLKTYPFFIQLPITGLIALTLWVLYALDKRKQVLAVVILGNIPPALVILVIIPLFLPLAQLLTLLAGR